MFISDYAIRKPVVTTVVMLALAIFGIFALATLDTDEFPDVQPPIVNLAIPYPGASPDVVEREVVDRMEEAIAGISGVKRIVSSSLDSFATITVEFLFGKDINQATQEIRDKISEIRNDLPPEMEEPILTRFDPADLPIVSLSLTSQRLSPAQLTRLADPTITRELRGVTGVAEVNVVGGVERQLVVGLKPEALKSADVSIAQVVQAVQSQNIAAPVGRLTGRLDERTIRLRGRLESPHDFEQIGVTQSQGRLVRLGDLADITDGTEEPRSAALFSGRPAVGIDVVKSKGFSTTTVAEEIRARVAEIQKTLPEGVELRMVRDAGVRVEDSVSDVQNALIEGAVLTVLVVFLFLNSWRSTIITGLALPVSVLAAFMAVWAFGFTLNVMSLLGLSLAIGILIDDAIVVRENIVRHVHMGKDHYTASREGTSEIGLAVAATTFSIVVVFVPIAFMGGLAQQWFAPFALTIAASVLVSLFVSFSLDPMLSAYWPDPHREGRKAWITRVLDRFNHWFESQAERYKRVVAWALDHRLAVIIIVVVTFFGALALPAVGILGTEFFPVQDVNEFIINLETPPGSNLEYTLIKAEEVGRMAREMPEVAYTYTTIGGRSGSVDEGQVYVRLKPKAERSVRQEVVTDELRRRTARLVGVTAAIGTGGFDNAKRIQLQLRGPETRELASLADRVADEIKKVPGAVDVGLSTRGQKPELNIQVDRGMAGSLGITVGQLAQALRPAFAGIDSGDWVDPEGETRDVEVRLVPAARANMRDIEGLPLMVFGQDGAAASVPLAQVATINQSLGPARIDHLNRDRVITVGANTAGRPLSEVMKDINQTLAGIALPTGYRITQGGEVEDQQEVFTRILMALALAIMLMYLVLVVQFGSFLDPLAILASLPLSLIGVMLGLLVTGATLNLMSMIGVILLAGIVAKNAILLIDFAKWSHEEGMPLREALIEAGRVRLRPILMTTFALIAGMIPVALGLGEGADFRRPLGIAVIGGVVTSTFLTLLVIPTFYEILAGGRDWLRSRLQRTVDHPHPTTEPQA
ncbi:MAG: efflux RND transporter permease subunit [Acidobacteria bacterium]|nr:MAG: efflux RND transporter permease subunit [Acidobacteriota bacterium]